MINMSREERAPALEYATASSSFPLPEAPFAMIETRQMDPSDITMCIKIFYY